MDINTHTEPNKPMKNTKKKLKKKQNTAHIVNMIELNCKKDMRKSILSTK